MVASIIFRRPDENDGQNAPLVRKYDVGRQPANRHRFDAKCIRNQQPVYAFRLRRHVLAQVEMDINSTVTSALSRMITSKQGQRFVSV
jgi:hypothetical protein